MVVAADKGNASVLMDREEYITKALVIIEHKSFDAVKRCPKNTIEKKLNKFLLCLFQERPLPRFYGLGKIHKQDALLHPAISAILPYLPSCHPAISAVHLN